MHNITGNYLRAIFEGSYLTGKMSNKRLAKLLGVSPATTTEQVKKMCQKGLVTSSRYGAVSLSEEGEKKAEQLIKKFRLCEVWLDDEFGLPLAEIASQAWQLASFNSQNLFEQLNQRLNFPTKTPFGASVQEPRVLNTALLSLNSTKEQQKCILAEYLDNQRVIDYVQQIGLEVGQEYFVEKIACDFDILFLSSKEKRQLMVSREVAKYIYVKC
ncbi:metal-dependent transcriptional regulator [Ligilactobacillus acidipiscis]|jgi:DtxR family Mn-dependent transcriptional regulator|uniref:metal-dependent transcriptional regulator n=1 Tax=Ligilactobacillus acidipiscis TaxID=89059 RepID=UPI002FD9A09A